MNEKCILFPGQEKLINSNVSNTNNSIILKLYTFKFSFKSLQQKLNKMESMDVILYRKSKVSQHNILLDVNNNF